MKNVMEKTRESRFLVNQVAGFLKNRGFSVRHYIECGFDELDQAKLPDLIQLKYHTFADATEILGDVDDIKNLFIGFQKHLYQVTFNFQ